MNASQMDNFIYGEEKKKSLVDCNGLMRQRVYVCNWMENVNILSCGIILYPEGLFALQPLACWRHR